jgi:hypothetical protein
MRLASANVLHERAANFMDASASTDWTGLQWLHDRLIRLYIALYAANETGILTGSRLGIGAIQSWLTGVPTTIPPQIADLARFFRKN